MKNTITITLLMMCTLIGAGIAGCKSDKSDSSGAGTGGVSAGTGSAGTSTAGTAAGTSAGAGGTTAGTASAGTGGASGTGTAGTAAGTGAAGTAAGTGAAGTAAGTGAAGTGTAGTGATESPSCDTYCTDITAHCTATHSQYGSPEACSKICATFPAGTAADTTGATRGCHAYHAGTPAMTDPTTHCPHAGPLGSMGCGTDCENFCAETIAVCSTQATPPYADLAACMTACGNFKGTDMVPYSTAVQSGDSLACRMYHLSVASTTGNTVQHCPHTGAVSAACHD